MTPPPWPARRVGDRVLCGRRVAGRYVCTGEIATVGRVKLHERYDRPASGDIDAQRALDTLADYGRVGIRLPPGLIEGPAGFWSPSPRARRAAAAGRAGGERLFRQVGNRADLAAGSGRHKRGPDLAPALPLRRKCPHCQTVATVLADVLRSEPTE